MASRALRGLRQWISAGHQYSQLPTDGDVEYKGAGPEAHAAGGILGGILGGVFALRLLVVRIAHLCLSLVATRSSSSSSSSSSGPVAYSHAANSWLGIFERLGRFQVFVPSFLHPTDPSRPVKRPHPSAWLDGMRGVAALFVVLNHCAMLAFSWNIRLGYGSRGGANLLIQLPFIRLIVAGAPQVAVFYVISGYALSYKPLKLARAGRFAEAGEAIGSSTFRRWPRLFFMPISVTLVSAIMCYLDFYGTTGWEGGMVHSRPPPQQPTFWAQMTDWAASVISLTDPFSRNLRRGRSYPYDQFLWTLPIEFDCSMALFLCQAAFNRIRPNIRLLFMLAISSYAMRYGHWQVYLFTVGMIICDLQFAFSSAPPTPAPTTPARGSGAANPAVGEHRQGLADVPFPSADAVARYSLVFSVVFYICSIYLLCFPEAQHLPGKTPGFITLYNLIPEYHKMHGLTDVFWVPLGATFLVLTVDRSPPLQRIYTHPFTAYLGKISYSMYVVHGPLLFTIGHWFLRRAAAITGTTTNLQLGCCVALASAFFFPTLACVADLVTRTLDKWALSFGHQLYQSFTKKLEPIMLGTPSTAPTQ